MEFDAFKAKVEKELKLKPPSFIDENAKIIYVGEIELGPTQKLLFSISNFRQKNYIDIRTWFQNETGEWKPTKKGIHLSLDKFSEFDQLIKLYGKISQLDEG